MTLTIPKQHDADREDADDRPDRPRRDEDRHVQQLPDVPFGEKTSVQVDVKPVPGETEHREQQRRVSRSSSRSSRCRRSTLACRDRGVRGRRSSRSLGVRRVARACGVAAAARRAAGAARRRSPRPGRLRRLAAGPDRRPPPRRRRGRRRASPASTAGSTARSTNTVGRPLRRLRGHGRPPVGLASPSSTRRAPARRDRDPGPRLRADLREGARPGRRSVALSPEEQEAVERAMAR